MRIAVATDHAGLPLKQVTVDRLRELEHEVVDFGVDTPEPVDYPDVIAPAARAVAAGECQLGIVFGGSGSGEQITANKVRGIRCIQATEPVTARLGREHNDANMMAIGARIVGTEVALGCVEAFVSAEYQGGRHAARVAKLDALDAKRQGSTG
jgi:ribose 5-phosphate isomerase B